jgi:hypothetical protein
LTRQKSEKEGVAVNVGPASISVPSKNFPRWILVLVALAALSAVFVSRGAMKAMKMKPEAANNSQFAQMKPNEAVKVVVEVTDTAEENIRGRILNRKDDTHYVRTEDELDIKWNAATSIVMGRTADLHQGAIVHVTGTVAADHSLQARQIVILTGYVQVK